jgi:hypothetical protein
MHIRALAAAAALTLAPAIASATVNLNADQPIYTFASFNAAGNPIANNISYSYPFGTPTADNGSAAYWTATTHFAQPAPGKILLLGQLRPDDRTVVMLNGAEVAAYGGLGPGTSTFVFTPGGPEVPQYFLNSCCESSTHKLNAVVFGPFVPGVNTLEFIINNTNDGIFGNIVDSGPSRLSFEGSIRSGPSVTPEPTTWAMMLVGVFGLGVAMRSRRGPAIRAA